VAGDWLSGESVHIILKTPYLVEEKCEVKVMLFTVSQRLAEDTVIVNSSLAAYLKLSFKVLNCYSTKHFQLIVNMYKDILCQWLYQLGYLIKILIGIGLDIWI